MFAHLSYRQNQPKTFSRQSTLPRLPIPDLDKALNGYSTSLIPILEQTYTGSTLKTEIEKRHSYIQDFAAPEGIGRKLHERLKDLDHVSPNNWLDDTLWTGLAYHTWRAPLLINSNWWLMFADDPSTLPPPGPTDSSAKSPNPNPEQSSPAESQQGGDYWLKSHEKKDLYPSSSHEAEHKREEVTDVQLKRAAWLVHRFAQFRTRIQREEILPDSSKAGPFCMSQYAKLYNFSRIPLPNSDTFSVTSSNALHMTVMIDDFVYSVDVFSAPGADGITEPLDVGVICGSLKSVVMEAKERRSKGEIAVPVGILTADERNSWTKNREHILSLDPTNRSTLEVISSSLLMLSLDTYTLPSLPTRDPLRLPSVDASVRNCASGINGGQNRWFDKPLSVMVETNGRAGMMGEHSPVDALIPSIIVDYVLAEPIDLSSYADHKQGSAWTRLDWVVDDNIRKEIEECRNRNNQLIEDSDASQLWWGEFGADWIKATAKQSPDAFIQQALQLAWYKDQGYATATYETASTRMMLHGRTDVIRSLTSESREFVSGMLDDSVTDDKRYVLLTKAVKAHNTLTKTASAGHGYDRYLMGLKTRLRPGESHPLFEDEMYAKSQEWKLSTSGLSAGKRFMGTGFGAGYPDGYGINYLAGPYLIKFGIESKTSCKTTSTTKFKHHLAQSLRDMRRICESVNGDNMGTVGKARL